MIKPSTLMQRFLLLAFLLLVFGPLAALLVDLVRALAAGHADWLGLMLPLGRRMGLFFRSLGLSLCTAGAGMLCGFFSALYLWRLRSGFGSCLRWFVLLWIMVPPYIHALTWMTLIHHFNLILNNIGLAGIPFQGWFAAWWIQVMALAPIAIGLTLIGFESIDPALIESSRILREERQTLFKVMLPLAKPLVLAGGGFVFLLSFIDYGVPSLFHLNVYPLEIFAEYSAGHEPARALLSSVPLLLVAFLILSVSQGPLRTAILKPPAPLRPRPGPLVFPAWVNYLQGLAVVLLVAQLLVPVLVLTLTAGTWEQILGSIGAARREIFFTFGIAAVTALLSLPLGFSAAQALIQPGKYAKGWWLLTMAPLAVPAPLIGIGLIAVWNQPIVGAVYGTAWMPVLAWSARFTPLAALVLAAQLRRLDPLLIDAARLFQTSRSKAWLRIYLPMLAPGLLAAGFIVFALCAGELAAGLIVAPPGRATLIMRIYNYLHYGASETVAGLCLFMTVTAGGLAGLTGFMLSKKGNSF